MTSRNPFRRAAQTPAATGETTNSSTASSHYAPPPGPPPARSQDEAWQDVALPESPSGEMPPPYSAQPNFNHGESTVEIGPRRPFQPQPQPQQPPSQAIPPHSTGNRPPGNNSNRSAGFTPQQIPRPRSTGYPGAGHGPDHGSRNITPQQSGYGWGSGFEPGGRPPTIQVGGSGFTPQQTGNSHSGPDYGWGPGYNPPSSSNRSDPPPRHPSVSERAPSSNQSSAAPENLSDFAREFYAAGAEHHVPEEEPEHLPIPGSYAPPPGQPPARRPTRSADSSPTSGPSVPNDGKPTTTPVPGHPLLNRNRVLVYPKGYQCQKCHNTGYKAFDPSSPCSRCWDNYAKSFSGAIAYAPWTPSAATANYQRPLPNTMPRSVNPKPSSNMQHARSISDFGRSISRLQNSPLMRTPLNSPQIRIAPPMGLGPQPMGSPNHVVVPPGDSRIGGRLCWKCFGSGSTVFLIFEETCSTCGGIGRIMS